MERKERKIRTLIKYLLAFCHLSNKAVCEVSSKMGNYDFHDYGDSELEEPWHFFLLVKDAAKGSISSQILTTFS